MEIVNLLTELGYELTAEEISIILEEGVGDTIGDGGGGGSGRRY